MQLKKSPMSFLPPKDLQALWDQRLKESGFKDIETPKGVLKEWVSSRSLPSRGIDSLKIESKTNYYRLAGNFLYDYPFFVKQERQIWADHCEGKSFGKIAKKFNRSRSGIGKIVLTLKKKMLEFYSVKT